MQITTTESSYLIIDAEHLLYRNYFANKNLRTTNGKPSGAFYGFLNSLIRLKNKHGFIKIFVAWGDKRADLIRRKVFPEYKSNRDETPQDLIQQKKDLQELLASAGIPQFTSRGYEADDIIFLLCKKLRKKYPNSFVDILTGDKDLTQLVTSYIRVIKPDGTLITKENFATHAPVNKPRQIVWFLSLLGDTSDNVPGVYGIGEKGAFKYVNETSLKDCKSYNDLIHWSIDESGFTENQIKNFLDSAQLIDLVGSPFAIKDNAEITNLSAGYIQNLNTIQELLDQYEIKQFSASDLPTEQKQITQIESVKNCFKCSALVASRSRIVPHVLYKDSDIMFIAEAPGRDEDIEGTQPLVGEAGKKYNEMLSNVDISRYDTNSPLKISIANTCRCRPPNNRDPEKEEIANCLPYLQKEIQFVNPKVIVPMGNVALRALLNDPKASIQNNRGKIFTHNGMILAPTWHPSYINRAPAEQGVWERDIKEVIKWLKGERIKDVVDHKVIHTVDELREYIERMKQFPTNTFDYETAGLIPNLKQTGGEALCISLSAKEGEARLFPFYGQFLSELRPNLENEKAKALLRDWLKNTPKIAKIAHNAEYELRWSIQWLGLKTVNDIPNLQCTQLMHAAIDENSPHNLKDLSVRYTRLDRYEEDVNNWAKKHNHKKEPYFDTMPDWGKDNYAYIPNEVLWKYALIDADATHRLYPIFVKEIYHQNLQEFVFKYYFKWMKFFARVKMRGFKVDLDYLNKMIQAYQIRVKEAEDDLYSRVEVKKAEKLLYEQRITEAIEKVSARYEALKNRRMSKAEYLQKYVYDKITPERLNFDSSKQLPVLFYDILKLKKYTTDKGNPAFGKEVMEAYEQAGVPFIKQLMNLRRLEKFLSTFLIGAKNNLLDDRLHTDLRLDIAVTGRLASRNPNLQNIPNRSDPEKAKEIRDMFIADDGYILLAKDYSQIEFRIWAHYSQDPQMIKDINDGLDIHKLTASQVYNIPIQEVTYLQRGKAKNTVFGIMYGRGAQSVADEHGMTLEEANAFINAFFGRYPRAKAWIEENKRFVKKHGFTINVYGRKRHLQATINSPINNIRAEAERQSVNAPIQGGASDTNNLAAMLCQDAFDGKGIDAHVQLLVHDQIIMCVRKDQLKAADEISDKVMLNPTKKLSIRLDTDGEVGYKMGSFVDRYDYYEKGDTIFKDAA